MLVDINDYTEEARDRNVEYMKQNYETMHIEIDGVKYSMELVRNGYDDNSSRCYDVEFTGENRERELRCFVTNLQIFIEDKAQ